MLPGFSSGQLSPGTALGQVPNYSSSPAAPLYPPGQPPSRQNDLQQGYPSSPDDIKEDSSFIAADDDPDEEAAAADADNTCESAVEGPFEAAGYGDLSAREEEAKQRRAVTGTTDESATADMKAAKASKTCASLSDRESVIQAKFLENQSAEPRIKADEAMPQAVAEASQNGEQSAPGGSGILDEYMRRMHFSKETSLQAPLPNPGPPGGAPAHVSMPRRWTKTNSYPDGQSSSLFCSSCSSPKI